MVALFVLFSSACEKTPPTMTPPLGKPSIGMPPPEEKKPTPEEGLPHPEVLRITCEEVKQLMDKGVELILVDSRDDMSFQGKRLKGAINIPATPRPPLTEEMITARLLTLPKDKLVVFYCD